MAPEKQLENPRIRKGDSHSQIAPPSSERWLEECNVLQGQPLHPLKHALQIFPDTSKEGWGSHLNKHTARGTWTLPESKNPDLVFQGAGFSKSPTHSRPAKCGSRQVIQVRLDHSNIVISPSRGLPGNMQQVAPTSNSPICYKVQQQTGLVCVTSSRPLGLGSLLWEDLDSYALPPVAILGKVVEKLQDYPCSRIILIAPGWANMPWFWHLVTMSSQIPLCLTNLPNLLIQPFSQTTHRNLSKINLHAWLLEPQQSKSRASLRQWQHELRLLKEDQPDQSMRQSEPFLQVQVVPQ